jgi:hypothetical protein
MERRDIGATHTALPRRALFNIRKQGIDNNNSVTLIDAIQAARTVAKRASHSVPAYFEVCDQLFARRMSAVRAGYCQISCGRCPCCPTLDSVLKAKGLEMFR